jgi:hypothetical protein
MSANRHHGTHRRCSAMVPPPFRGGTSGTYRANPGFGGV